MPSPTGVADVFAFNSDGTIQAIRSDGTTAWTAHLSSAVGPVFGVPDFLGGMVAVESQSGVIWDTIVRLDGMTGQPSTLYTANPSSNGVALAGLHPDGTVFAFLPASAVGGNQVIGIDPTTGAQKFIVPLPQNTFGPSLSNSIIAGDGNFYLAYITQQSAGGGAEYDLKLLQVSSSGASATMTVTSWLTPNFCDVCLWEMNMITNADTGIVLTWTGDVGSPGMAVTTGTSVSVVNYPSGPNGGPVVPVLQAQDGSFIGTVGDGQYQNNLIAFDQAGNLRWSVPGNWAPQIATADGGIIATDYFGNAVTFDEYGNATGQMASLPTYSWRGLSYQDGPIQQLQVDILKLSSSFAAAAGGNLSGNGGYVWAQYTPERGLQDLVRADLTAPLCNALLSQFAQMRNISVAGLVAELRVTAYYAQDHVHDGPSSTVSITNAAAFLTTAADSGTNTVGAWFDKYSTQGGYADGLSQFNSDDVWVRYGQWTSWIMRHISWRFLNSSNNLNSYAMATLMHEILHKQSVAGGFSHLDMDNAIRSNAVLGYLPKTNGYNSESLGIAQACFANLR